MSLQTISTLTPLLSVAAIIIAGAFSFVQWIDLRGREIKQRRWIDYSTVLSLVGGSRPDGTKITGIEQVVALYQLLEFTEYAFITVRALAPVMATDNPAQKEWKELNEAHLKDVLRILRSQRSYKQQAAKFA